MTRIITQVDDGKLLVDGKAGSAALAQVSTTVVDVIQASEEVLIALSITTTNET